MDSAPSRLYPTSSLIITAPCLWSQTAMTKCLLALSNPNILGAGVERLLSSIDNLELVSLPIQGTSGLLEAIQQVQADVVLIEDQTLLGPDCLTSLLTTRPWLLVIQIESDDNQLQIYQHQHISIREASELVTLIQSQ